VLTQLLVPKTACKISEETLVLTRQQLLQTEDQVQVSTNAVRLWIILPHRLKKQAQKST